MKTPKIVLLCILLAVSPCLPLFSADFGLVLDQSVERITDENNSNIIYSALLVPRISAPLGDSGEFFFSAGLNFQTYPFCAFVPELLRTDFSWRFGSLGFRVGRMVYSDPLGYVATGLFDGARVSLDTRAGNFSLGGWYTGLLYKNRAEIFMTDNEREAHLVRPDFSDFDSFRRTYFAPSRFVFALGWDHPSLGHIVRSRFAFLGQFDLGDEDLNSQYFIGRILVPFRFFSFDLGACFGLAQHSGEQGRFFSADAEIALRLSNQRLAFMGRYASGVNGNIGTRAFLPITTVPQGTVFQTDIPGISMFSLDYLLRLHRTMSLGLTSSYFIRNDLTAHPRFAYDYQSDGHLLGNEFVMRVFWNPASDLQFNLAGGVFKPGLGNVIPEAGNIWRVVINAVLSLR